MSRISPSRDDIKSFMALASSSLGTPLPAPKDVFAFNEGGSATTGEKILELALSGAKTATTSWPVPTPRHWDVGDVSVIVDGAERPVAVMRTLSLQEYRFRDVPEGFALAEAEGSYEDYRTGHIEYYRKRDERGPGFGDDSMVLCERFEIVFSIRERKDGKKEKEKEDA